MSCSFVMTPDFIKEIMNLPEIEVTKAVSVGITEYQTTYYCEHKLSDFSGWRRYLVPPSW